MEEEDGDYGDYGSPKDRTTDPTDDPNNGSNIDPTIDPYEEEGDEIINGYYVDMVDGYGEI